jgi:hypothetical protein
MYWQIWRSSGSFEPRPASGTAHREGLGHQLQPDGLDRPAPLAQHRVEQLLLEAGQRIAKPAQPLVDVAGQHLRVPRLVHHLGRLEQLRVAAAHALHQLAAHQHGAVLAVEQHAEPPVGEAPVELGALLAAEAVPVRRVVDVDEVVGQHAVGGIERLIPVDVLGGVPLVPLGVLVQPAEIRRVDRVAGSKSVSCWVAMLCGWFMVAPLPGWPGLPWSFSFELTGIC